MSILETDFVEGVRAILHTLHNKVSTIPETIEDPNNRQGEGIEEVLYGLNKIVDSILEVANVAGEADRGTDSPAAPSTVQVAEQASLHTPPLVNAAGDEERNWGAKDASGHLCAFALKNRHPKLLTIGTAHKVHLNF